MKVEDDVDVIVPAFNNASDLGALLVSLKTAITCRRIVVRVVDDASSDDIASLVPPNDERCCFIYSRNARNLGFAASVNEAIAASRNDVVLLNSDTLVFGDWIDRLAEVVRAHPRTATVTPLSNAATILSYPHPLINNADLADISWEAVDRICAAGPRLEIEIPTGVGFCMFVTRACLDEVGALDAQTFREGYGEECDLCRRAAARGWRNLAAPHVFVWHRGGGSFLERSEALSVAAQSHLLRRYPDYTRRVATFIKADPLRSVRAGIDAARVAIADSPRRLMLGDRPETGGPAASTFYLQRCGSWMRRRWRLAGTEAISLPNLPLLGVGMPRVLDWLLHACRFDEIVLPRVSGIPRPMQAAILGACARADVPVIVSYARTA